MSKYENKYKKFELDHERLSNLQKLNYDYNDCDDFNNDVDIVHHTACFEPEIIHDSNCFQCEDSQPEIIHNENCFQDNIKNTDTVISKNKHHDYSSSNNKYVNLNFPYVDNHSEGLKIPGVNYKNIEVINEELEIAHTDGCGHSKDSLLKKIDNQQNYIKFLEEKIKNSEKNQGVPEHKYNKLLEDNEILSNQLKFALEYLDTCFNSLNKFFNIIFNTDKNIDLHKFNKNDLKDFLNNIQNRLNDLIEKENNLNDLLNSQPQEKIIYKNDPATNALLNKLMAENAHLRDLLKNSKKTRFDDSELFEETCILFDLPELEEEDEEEVEEVETNKNKKKIKGKVKKIDPNNLYDKYCGENKAIFNAFGWAADGFQSVVENKGSKKKLISHNITQKLNLHPKQIVPVKKKTFAFLLNKPKKKNNSYENDSTGFIREQSTAPVTLHNFE